MSTQPSVTIQQVRESNARIDKESSPKTAVFVGGTAGIGEATSQQLALNGKGNGPSRIYIIGRPSAASRVKPSLDRLRLENPDVDLIWLEGDVSLMKDVQRICEELKNREESLDVLFMSTGYSPLGGREDTEEGLVISMALGYYSRMLFMRHLLPLLRASPRQGRVVSLFAGGRETTRVDVDNLNFDEPGSFGPVKSQFHTISMLTMGMEQLAEENKDVTFIHASPGLVNTGNLNRGWKNRWILQVAANIVITPFFWIVGFSIEESRDRMIYLMTSAKYGGKGVPVKDGIPRGFTTRGEETGGLYLVSSKGDSTRNEKVLDDLRKNAKQRIMEKTEQILRPYL